MQDILRVLKKNTMLIALVVVAIFFQWLTKGVLFVPQNVTNLIAQNAYVVILATGMLICILTGGNIDLSVGSIVCFVGAVAAVMMVRNNMNIYFCIAICLLLGVAIGVWQGFWIAYARIPAFIVTLSGMLLWRGAANIVLKGLTISPFPTSMTRYFIGFIESIPGLSGKFTLPGLFLSVGAYRIIVLIFFAVIIGLTYTLIQLFGRNKEAQAEQKKVMLKKTALMCAFVSLGFIILAVLLSNYKGVFNFQGILLNEKQEIYIFRGTYLISVFIFGAVAVLSYILFEIFSRIKKSEKESVGRAICKCILISAAIMIFAILMARYSVTDANNIVAFKGGDCYIISVLVGILVSIIYIILQIAGRLTKIKKGYETEKLIWIILRCALICAAIIALMISLSQYNGIPGVLIVLAVIVLVYSYFTSRTVYGRHIYALGGNEKAAKLSGINTNKMLFFAYVNMSFLAAVTALVCVARYNAANPSMGTSFELDAIGACFIGGASAYGGTGTVGGAVIGAIFMGVLNNGMSIAGVGIDQQRVIKALVLLAAVAFDVLSKRRSKAA